MYSVLRVLLLFVSIDLCGTLKSIEIAIHIVALVLSVMITLISTVILAVVLIVWPCNKCNPDEEVEYELQKNGEKVMLSMAHCVYRIPTYSTSNSKVMVTIG